VDVLRLEDGDHLAGELANLGSRSFLEEERGHLQGDESGVVGDALVEEAALRLGKGLPGLIRLAEPGGDAGLDPAQPHPVELAARALGKLLDLGEERPRLGETTGLAQVIQEVVPGAGTPISSLPPANASRLFPTPTATPLGEELS